MGFIFNNNVLNQKGSPAIYTDTFANRPNFGFAGRLFISNDTAAIYEDTGTAWVLIANVSSGAGTLQQVTTNGNTSNVGISVTAGGVSTNTLTVTTLTPGSVPFVGTAGLITQDNPNLFFDDTNNRLGINTNTPGNSLDVHTAGTNPTLALNNTAGNQSAISFLNSSVAKWRIGNTSTNTFDIYNFVLSTIALQIKANNNAVFISSVQADDFLIQPTGYSLLASLSRNLTGAGYGVLSLRNNANGTIQPTALTVDRTYTLPDATGTISLTTDLAAYLPLAGGTLSGTLNGTNVTFNSANDFLNNTGASTTTKFIRISNTSADMAVGVEGSTPTQIPLAEGGIAYSTVFKSVGTTSLILGTVSKAALTINTNQQVSLAQGLTGTSANFNSTVTATSFIGNASTATALATARTIAGVSFDGTANISLNNNNITNGAGYIPLISSTVLAVFNTYTTFYSTANFQGLGMYMVIIGLNNTTDWYAGGIVYTTGAIAVLLSSFNSVNVSVQMSGQNIQVRQIGTSPNITLSYKIISMIN
jgi:hypothetical protein